MITWIEKRGDITINEQSIEIIATGGTDYFLDPQGNDNPMIVPWLMFRPVGMFIFSAKVTADLISMYDAGGLMIYKNNQHWAKLCLEVSPNREIISISVVTPNSSSDDCVHEYLDTNEIYLRISRLSEYVYCFHSSNDGETWKFMRYFELKVIDPMVGIMAQCPHGEQNSCLFSNIEYSEATLKDMRNGK